MFISRKYYYVEQKPEQQQKTDSKIQAMEMTFLRAILNKTKKDRITKYQHKIGIKGTRNKKDIQKCRLSWFGHVIRMGEERKPKKIIHRKMDGKRPRLRPRTELKRI